jgi:hypothetical protein
MIDGHMAGCHQSIIWRLINITSYVALGTDLSFPVTGLDISRGSPEYCLPSQMSKVLLAK